jgi:hypothetical protein
MTLVTAQVRDVAPVPLTVTDTYIMYHLTNFDASRNVILHMRYVSTCVAARVVGGGGEVNKEQKLSAVAHVILTCDKYKSSLRSGTFIIKDERYIS